MNKTLIILGGIIHRLDNESQAYVDDFVPMILADLNEETLFKHTCPELINDLSQEEFDYLFNFWNTLGNFLEYKESSGGAAMKYNEEGISITADYIAQVEFEGGPSEVTIGIIKRDNIWQIFEFNISSDLHNYHVSMNPLISKCLY
jgi:hypothetical protein